MGRSQQGLASLNMASFLRFDVVSNSSAPGIFWRTCNHQGELSLCVVQCVATIYRGMRESHRLGDSPPSATHCAAVCQVKLPVAVMYVVMG